MKNVKQKVFLLEKIERSRKASDGTFMMAYLVDIFDRVFIARNGHVNVMKQAEAKMVSSLCFEGGGILYFDLAKKP